MIDPVQLDADTAHANDIRLCVQELRDAIVAARNTGLEVKIPLMLVLWLETGNPPGEPAAWTIKRRSL